MLSWRADEQGIEPHVTVFENSARKDGTFSREDFSFDQTKDVYICPGERWTTTVVGIPLKEITVQFG
jgi:hypothetical protein